MLSEEQEKLLEKIHAGEDIPVEGFLEDIHPADIAACLNEEDVSDEELTSFFQHEDKEFLASVLEQSDDGLQARVVALLPYTDVIRIFSYMSKDDIADILGDLPIDLRKKLLNLMKASDSRELSALMGYGEDTAGGIMTTEYIALRDDLTIAQTLVKIKEIAPKTEVIETIFVLNKNRELVGIADLRDILIAPNDDVLSSIMDETVISVFPEQDQEEVSLLVNKYDLTVIPVINRRHALLGIITVDDIMDVMVEEQTEDILRLGGIGEVEEIGGPINISVRRRLPWLFINLLTAFIAASAIALFDDVIAQVAALASMMTIVSGMGGNAGTQTLSLAIRGITLGEIDLKSNWKLVFKEVAVGLLDGAAIGFFTGIVFYFRYGNIYLGLIILLAMTGNLIIAGLSGFLIPLIIKKLGADPALSSSIFLTTMTDTCGFFIFLGLAKLFLPLLVH
ncbi:MAG: magnesium transporter [Butyrivibrio sp.]|jgi:magnesium transporter|nr:magnesium transporter [Butyrivibrio sp.]